MSSARATRPRMPYLGEGVHLRDGVGLVVEGVLARAKVKVDNAGAKADLSRRRALPELSVGVFLERVDRHARLVAAACGMKKVEKRTFEDIEETQKQYKTK